MGKYYKISPQWAEKMNMTDRAVRHPDGWYLCTMPMMASIGRKLASGSAIPTADEAAAAIGAVTLTEAEALASQRGERFDNTATDGGATDGGATQTSGAVAPEAGDEDRDDNLSDGSAEAEPEGEAEAAEAEEADGEEVSDGN